MIKKTSVILSQFKTVWEGISTSYWFIPVCMMLFSLGLCTLCLSTVNSISIAEWARLIFPSVSQASAQQILSTIAGAIITATSIAFSMTLVALTMASSQFGPRLLRTFMLDKGTQVVLGLLVSTFLFCLIALHHLGSDSPLPKSLDLLSGISVILAIIDVFSIIYFIHHIARFIQADEIIHRCYLDCLNDIAVLLPYKRTEAHRTVPEELLDKSGAQTKLFARQAGYVQTINYTGLTSSKTLSGLSGVTVLVRSGDHIFPGAHIMTIHGDHEYGDDELSEFHQNIILGSRRTPLQDPEFAIGQLVELALRALSPGINDPVTAVTCLDKLAACCIAMEERPFPAAHILNTDTQLWLSRRIFSLQSVVDTTFDQIRQAGRTHVAIALKILDCLKKMEAHFAVHHHKLLYQQAQATYELVAEESVSERDIQSLKQAYSHFQSV